MAQRVLVLCQKEHDALQALPKDAAEFGFAEKIEEVTDTSGVEAVVTIPPVEAKGLELLPGLKWVHSFSAGVDYLAKDGVLEGLANREEVTLTNGRGAFSSSLSEYIMSSILHFNKCVPRCQENKKLKKWDKFIMPTVRGKQIGFIGFGDIAREAARIARDGFAMKVSAFRRNPSNADSGLADEIYTDKLAIFRDSDFVVCTLPGTDATKHFCSAPEFEAMKEGAIFVSCGRGVAVDEEALSTALNSKKIFAALDVFETEPLPQESQLWDVPNDRLLITAHNADNTDNYFRLGWDVFLSNLRAFQSRREMETPVNKSAGY